MGSLDGISLGGSFVGYDGTFVPNISGILKLAKVLPHSQLKRLR